jgi:hypothetical protein
MFYLIVLVFLVAGVAPLVGQFVRAFSPRTALRLALTLDNRVPCR